MYAQASICVSRAMKWWEKTLHPNMVEIHSAQELVDSLKNAGDRLVVVDFYSPGCGGCRALHPKICQLAELNPGAIFLKVNYEELKTMCHALNIHVLPFFRFYKGAEGRIKKFKDAMAKHGTGRCNLGGPAKGLDESEMLKLASIGELSTTSSSPSIKEERVEDLVTEIIDMAGVWSNASHNIELQEESSIGDSGLGFSKWGHIRVALTWITKNPTLRGSQGSGLGTIQSLRLRWLHTRKYLAETRLSIPTRFPVSTSIQIQDYTGGTGFRVGGFLQTRK
ncbi:atypical CYS HIS rich thioredoxin 5 [Prunus dulcis]|uniref:Atypical CYS HIS rich thioredoxin 5 n=1 Tax=Prunus dulcis TaxID=3755 RepID=A0A4Y1RJ95_PRUDU|nr:atypical CYS HIS rich thioredoxin 5 [Prunus dulcis]